MSFVCICIHKYCVYMYTYVLRIYIYIIHTFSVHMYAHVLRVYAYIRFVYICIHVLCVYPHIDTYKSTRIRYTYMQVAKVGNDRVLDMEQRHAQEHDVLMKRVTFLEKVIYMCIYRCVYVCVLYKVIYT
jgi:hypothetical protein